jgi:hypothetical protein
VHTVQAGRQRRGVVRNDHIARSQKIDEPGSRRVRDTPIGADDKKPRVARPLDWSVGSNHVRHSCLH